MSECGSEWAVVADRRRLPLRECWRVPPSLVTLDSDVVKCDRVTEQPSE